MPPLRIHSVNSALYPLTTSNVCVVDIHIKATGGQPNPAATKGAVISKNQDGFLVVRCGVWQCASNQHKASKE